MDIFTKGALWDYWEIGGDEIEVSDDESSDLEEHWRDKEEETAKIFKIETVIFDYVIELSNMEELIASNTIDKPFYYKTNDVSEWPKPVVERVEVICQWSGNLSGAHELPVYNIRKFEMIKYSFRQDKEYVAVKEDEYDDLARTNDDACRAYQEIFRRMDEGWTDLVKEISTNIDGEFINLEILKCWSLETSRWLFNTNSCSINQHEESTEQISGEFLILILFNSVITKYLVNISKRRTFWSLNEDILKITILKTNTSYPSRKIRCIRACTQQRPQRKQVQYAVSSEDQYVVLDYSM
ncbi:hypothetical protein Tco_0295866 [Tanacetum coccineum]